MNQEPKPNSTLAITSLVLGIVSVLCLGILAGIPAIVTGHIARGRARKFPDRYGNAGLGLAGVILGYVSVVETVVILFVMLLPMITVLDSAKSKTQEILCVNNLRQVGLAVQMYAQDNKDEFPKTVTQLAPYLGTSKVLVCPSDPALKAESLDAKDFSKTSYVVTLEGASQTNLTKVIARCPVHNNTLTGDAAVQRGGR
jgi:hypothetical protein